MAISKTFESILVNETADGSVTVELTGWVAKAIKLSRTETADCTREDIQGVGVYFLMCEDENGNVDSLYICAAEHVHSRLVQHLNDYNTGKETYVWNTAMMFTCPNLNKDMFCYLEKRFVEIAKECGRCTILNEGTCKDTVPEESQIAGMEDFIDHVKLLMVAMGYNSVLKPASDPAAAPTPAPVPAPDSAPAPAANDETVYLFCKVNKSSAKGFVSPGGFTVLKGSIVSDHVVPYLIENKKSYYILRSSLEKDGIIVDRVFTRDYEFKTPYAAATVVSGRMSSDWKTADGTLLKDL